MPATLLLKFLFVFVLTACDTGPAGDDATSDERDRKVAAWLQEIASIPVANSDKRPIERYYEVLPGARGGDRDAQYELYRLYRFCNGNPGAAMTLFFKARGISDGDRRMLDAIREQCSDFDPAFDQWDSDYAAVKHSRAVSLAQNHPIAIAEASLTAYRRATKARDEQPSVPERQPPVPEVSLDEIYAALAHAAKHPNLMEAGVEQAYLYFRFFRAEEYMRAYGYDRSADRFKRGPLREAWSILGCHYTPTCFEEFHLRGMQRYYTDAEIDETVKTVVRLYEAIMAGDWKSLGLEGAA